MKHTHLYNPCIQKSLTEDQAEILSTLRAALAKQPEIEVRLINYYKGLPISLNAKITRVYHDSLDLIVSPRQAVAISDDRYTFIRSNLFEYDIVAKAEYADIKRSFVSLRQLSFVELCAERRNHIRLKVNPPIDGIYLSTEGTVRGEIVELSTAGAIMVVDYSVDIDTWREGKLLFKLPTTDGLSPCNIKVPARFLTVLEDSRLLRFVFGFTADKVTEKHLAKYLFNRQLEIIQMLKEGYEIGAS